MSNPSHHIAILLVDDDPAVLKFLAEVLEEDPQYSLTLALSGTQAITYLETSVVTDIPFAVVVTDIRMSDVDGLTVLRAANTQIRPPAVILITGYGTIDTAVIAVRHNAFDYLLKPLSTTRIRDSVIRAVTHYFHAK